MGFDLEHRGQTFADIDDPSVFSRSLDDILSGHRQFFEVYFGAFVAAVLRPHQGEYPQFGEIGIPSDELLYQSIFVKRQIVFFYGLFVYFGLLVQEKPPLPQV